MARAIGKQITELVQLYTKEQKYDRTNSSFDHKLKLFENKYKRIELPEEAFMKAFPVILKGLAEDHFNNNKLSELPFNKACANIYNFFERPNYYRQNLDEWNNTTLFSISTKNPNKTIYENVQLLINKLCELQYSLTPALRNTEFLHNKIVTVCQGSPVC